MSVALVVVRLEILEDHLFPADFSFSIEKFVVREDMSKSSISSVDNASKSKQPKEDLRELHTGRREFHEISIETIDKDDLRKEVLTGEKVDNKSSTPAAERKEVLSGEKVDKKSSTPAAERKEVLSGEKLDKKSSKPAAESKPGANRGTKKASKDQTTSLSKHPTDIHRRQDSGSPSVMAELLAADAKGAVASVVTFREGLQSDSPDVMDGGGSSKSSTKSYSPVPKLSAQLYFFSGNPSVEITKGILHLYKENQLTSLDDETTRSQLLCILSVPATLSSHDLVQYLCPIQEQGLEQIRIIRDSTPNRYMVLLKFTSQKLADEFYRSHNGKCFNSLEDYVCQLAYVAKVEAMKSSEGACFPVPGLSELPTCPVCLERMDESVNGVLTILCNHSFHSDCLYNWEDGSCPVCRYIQTPEVVADNKCQLCGSQESLWICLICGHVGCGRYVEGHAYQHYEDTHHLYAMQLVNQRVWDYAGDNYVHRLVQSKGDGKLVEWDRGEGLDDQEEKLESITMEYTYLLTHQLESQRLYFEEKLTRIEQDAVNQMEISEEKAKAAMAKCQSLEDSLTNMEKEKSALDRKYSQLNSKLTKLNTKLTEEKEMNKSLLQNQQEWQKKVNLLETSQKESDIKKDKDIQDLKEQLRDVMFFLEAQEKLKTVPEDTKKEIQEGQIFLGEPAADTKAKRGKKKK